MVCLDWCRPSFQMCSLPTLILFSRALLPQMHLVGCDTQRLHSSQASFPPHMHLPFETEGVRHTAAGRNPPCPARYSRTAAYQPKYICHQMDNRRNLKVEAESEVTAKSGKHRPLCSGHHILQPSQYHSLPLSPECQTHYQRP
jgi:hypothetical protein